MTSTHFTFIFYFFILFFLPSCWLFPFNPRHATADLETFPATNYRITVGKTSNGFSRIIHRYYYSCSPTWPVSFLRRRGLRSSPFTKGYARYGWTKTENSPRKLTRIFSKRRGTHLVYTCVLYHLFATTLNTPFNLTSECAALWMDSKYAYKQLSEFIMYNNVH